MRRVTPLLLALALATGVGGGVGAGLEDPVPGSLGHRGRWITDEHGRVVVLHGVNMVSKIAPYSPAALGFDADDADFLAREGFNTVRLGVIHKGLEPERGAYDDDYLEEIALTARMLGERGIHVLVDFHQDLFNERFAGEGFPDWAVIDDGLPAQPNAGFPGNYFVMPALWRAFDNFWANENAPDGTPLWDAFGQAWAHAAARLSRESAVFGYDVLNEPWPGTTWPSCVNPIGCPVFDALTTRFFASVFDAIRTVDDSRLVFYETHPVFGGGADVHIGDVGDDNAGFSFHLYCLGAAAGIPSELLGPASCPLGEDRPFERASAQSERTGDALLLSEFGATDDLAAIERVLEAADAHMVGWQYWSYWNTDPSGARPHEGIIHDLSLPPEGANVKEEKLDVLVRPYPRAIAGEPVGWGYEPEWRWFLMAFEADPTIDAPTEIVVPARRFSDGYSVEVSGPAIVTSAPDADVLTVEATGPGTVYVTVLG